jgi:hypothetical protein
MKVLYLTFEDCAGIGHRLKTAFNRGFGANDEAKHVYFVKNYLDYPGDIFKPDDEELARLSEWADVIHAFDDSSWRWKRFVDHKPLVTTYSGTWYRRYCQEANRRDSDRNAIQFCTTIDLERCGPEWLPAPMFPLGMCSQPPGNPWRVAHAPTNRINKGTVHIAHAASVMPNVKFDIIEGIPNEECLHRKRMAHIYVDQFKLGYGVNALESWAMMQPVIAHAEEPHHYAIVKKIGYLPYVDSAPEDLPRTISELVNDSKSYRDAVLAGNGYIMSHHAWQNVARRLKLAYEEVMERR